MRTVVGFVLLLLAAPSFAQAADAGEISGVILGAFHRPMSGQRVELSGPGLGPGLRRVELTDRTGRFTFMRLTNGTYHVEADFGEGDRVLSAPIVLMDGTRVAKITLERPPPSKPETTEEHARLADSFEHLRTLVEVGSTVKVADDRGREVRGVITRLSKSLTLVVDARELQLEAAEIRRIERAGDSLRDGALKGLGQGVLWYGTIVGGACLLAGCQADAGEWLEIATVAGVFGGIGAGVGIAVDAMVPGWQVVYRAHANRSSRFSLSPQIRGRSPGVQLALRLF
jgi:hypothetical protein